MTDPSLAQELQSYGIGDKLRTLRLKRKLGLVALARHTGLSAAMLSKLERGRLFPTLPTLMRVAQVYGVGLDHFFAAASPKRALGIVRAGERQRFPERLGGRDLAWEFECLDFTATERRMNAYRVRFLKESGKLRTHEHPGAEFLHLLHGRLAIVIAGEEHLLLPGDSIYFDAAQSHAYRRVGPRPAEALVVTVPA